VTVITYIYKVTLHFAEWF